MIIDLIVVGHEIRRQGHGEDTNDGNHGDDLVPVMPETPPHSDQDDGEFTDVSDGKTCEERRTLVVPQRPHDDHDDDRISDEDKEGKYDHFN